MARTKIVKLDVKVSSMWRSECSWQNE